MKSIYFKLSFTILLIIFAWLSFIKHQLSHLTDYYSTKQQKVLFSSTPEILSIIPPKILIKKFQPKSTNSTIKNVTLYLSPTDLIFGKINISSIELNNNAFQINTPPLYEEILKTLPKEINISGKNITINTDSIKFENVYFNLPKISISKAVTFNAYGIFELNNKKVNFNISTLIKFDENQLIAKNLHINLSSKINNQTIPLKIESNIIYIPANNSIEINDINCNFLNINMQGSLKILQNTIYGKINTSRFNLHETLANINKNILTDNDAFTKIYLATQISNNEPVISGTIDDFTIAAHSNNEKIIINTSQSIKINKYNNLLKDLLNTLDLIKIKKAITLQINSKNIEMNNESFNNVTSILNIEKNKVQLTSYNENFNYNNELTHNSFNKTGHIKTTNIEKWVDYLFKLNAQFDSKGTINYKSNLNCENCKITKQASIKSKKMLFNKHNTNFNNVSINIYDDSQSIKIDAKAHKNDKLYKLHGTINNNDIQASSEVYIKHPIVNEKITTLSITGSLKNPTFKTKSNSTNITEASNKLKDFLFKHFR